MFLGQNSINDTFGFMLNRCGLTDVWNSTTQNNRAYLIFMQRFLNLFMNRFEYKNIPEESKRQTFRNNALERWLFFAPAVALFKHPQLGLQALPVSGWSGERDLAGFPKTWIVSAGNGYKKELSYKDSVLMFNDDAYSIPFLHILYELSYLVDIDNTHRQNLFALRQPMLVEMTEDEQKSAQKFIDKIKEFDDIIKIRVKASEKSVRNSGNPYDMKVFNSGANYIGQELSNEFVTYMNRIYTYLGLNNVAFEKKERMLTGELSQNDQIVQSNYTNALICRRKSIEMANDMFGENIIVDPMQYEAPTTEQVNTQAQNFMGGRNDNIPADSTV